VTSQVLLALLPIVILIGLGAILRRRKFIEDGFWPHAERLSFYVLLPCLFFHGLATADLRALPVGALSATLIVSTCAVAALTLAVRPLMGISGPAFTSVFQGAVRLNSYVGVTLAAGLYGGAGVALSALCSAALVPTCNILCVLAFARYGSSKLGPADIVRQVFTNPLVVGSLAGIAFKVLGLDVPPGIEPALRALGAAALPIGLLCVGAALDFSSVGQWIKPIGVSSLFKFLALPAATVLAARAIGLTGPALIVAMIFQALPTATSAYITARQQGGDAPLMAGIVAAQTILAFAVLPLLLIGLTSWVGL
jgi:predicted permease